MRPLFIALATVFLVVSAYNIKRPTSDFVEEKLRKIFSEIVDDLRDQEQEGEYSEEAEESLRLKKDPKTADFAVKVSTAGLKHFLEYALSSTNEAVHHLQPAELRARYLGMDLAVTSLQVVDYKQPGIYTELVAPSTIRIYTNGGSVRTLGLYAAKYKTEREGQFEATLDDIQLSLTVNVRERFNALEISPTQCSHEIGDVTVDLLPSLPTQINDQLRTTLLEQIDKTLCPMVMDYVSDISEMLKNVVLLEDATVKNNVPSHDVIATEMDKHSLSVYFSAKSGPAAKSDDKQKLSTDFAAQQMLTLAISEDYVNKLLGDFVTGSDVIVQLHRLPEIAASISENCAETRCLGSLFDLHGLSDAELQSTLLETSPLKLKNDAASIELRSSTHLSYMNEKSGYRRTYLRFETKLKLEMSDIRVKHSVEHGRYLWSATWKIVDAEITRVESRFGASENIRHALEDVLIGEGREKLETLLSNHLNGELPLKVHDYMKLSRINTQIRDGELILHSDVKLHHKFFPPLQMVRG